MPTEPPPEPVPAECLPPQLPPFAREVNAHLRELPRLAARGGEGRFALIRGGEVLGVWDTSECRLDYDGPGGTFSPTY